MKWIITGSSGFVGRALCNYLMEAGESVRIIPRSMLDNYFDLKRYLESEKPDHIVNLAAYGNYHHQTEEDKIYHVNVNLLLNLLNASKEINYKSLINFSSSSVYGVKKFRMNESDTLNTDTFYGASKVAGEYLCRAFAKNYNKIIINLRPFSITGVGEQKNHLIPTLIKASYSGETIDFVRHPVHDYVDIQDLCDAVIKLGKYANTGEYNVGSGKQYSNQEVLDLVEKVTRKSIKYRVLSSMRSYDSDIWCADITKIDIVTGWYPKKSLEDSIKEMVNEHTS